MNFEETKILVERITQGQKEIGQKAMAARGAALKTHLTNWFNQRWTAKNAYANKLNLKNKPKEKERLNRIIEKINNYENNKSDFGGNDWQQKNFFSNESLGQTTAFKKGVVGLINRYLSGESVKEILKKRFPEDRISIGVSYNITDKNLQRQTYLHETKHLLEYLKEIIVKGDFDTKGTMTSFKKGEFEELLDSEGKAEAHGFDNLYRKDKKAFLNSKSGERFTSKPNTERVEQLIATKGKGTRLTDKDLSDIYDVGAQKYSKTLNKTIESIKKEKDWKNSKSEEELKEIQFSKYIKETKMYLKSIISNKHRLAEIYRTRFNKYSSSSNSEEKQKEQKEALELFVNYAQKAKVLYREKGRGLDYDLSANAFTFGRNIVGDHKLYNEKGKDWGKSIEGEIYNNTYSIIINMMHDGKMKEFVKKASNNIQLRSK